MRIKLDENMPEDLAGELGSRGIDADTASSEGLSGRPDEEVWRAAQSAGRLLITQDIGISDVRRIEPADHSGLVLIRLNNPNRRRLMRRALMLFETDEYKPWTGCLVVVSEPRVRVRRGSSN